MCSVAEAIECVLRFINELVDLADAVREEPWTLSRLSREGGLEGVGWVRQAIGRQCAVIAYPDAGSLKRGKGELNNSVLVTVLPVRLHSGNFVEMVFCGEIEVAH